MWDDVDLAVGTLTVRGQLQRVAGEGLQRGPAKTRQSRRTLAMPAPLIDALKRQRNRQREARLLAGSRWRETGYVFTTSVGTPLDARNITRRFHRALERAELPRINFHALRHSAASILLEMGASLHEIKEALGHSQISVTSNFYAHVSEELRKETADRTNRAFAEVG